MIRFVDSGADDVTKLCPDLTHAEIQNSDFGTYTESQFLDDMAETRDNRTDRDLCEIMVKNSNAMMHWLKSNGVRVMPYFGRRAYKIGVKS